MWKKGKNMDKQKILFVVDEQMYGGVSCVLRNILKSINYGKVEVDLLILHNRGDALVGHIPEQVHVLYGTRFFEVADRNIKAIVKTGNVRDIFCKLRLVWSMKHKTIGKYIQRERGKILSNVYDVEIAFKDGFCTLFTAYGESTKKITWVHGDYSTYDCTKRYAELFHEIYPKINTVVSITEDVSNSFNKIYHCEDKSIVIPNLVDSHEIIELSYKKEVDFAKDRLHFVCVGRLAEEKGYVRLLEQLGKLKQENILKNEMIHFIGDGDQRYAMEEIITKYHLEENVELVGYTPNPYPYMRKADMFILSSFTEGVGIVLFESLILRTPCFATRVANIEDTLENGKYGIMVENSDKGIYDGLKEILQDKGIIKAYQERVAGYVYTQEEKVVDRLDELLMRLEDIYYMEISL